jgi:DNA-binding NarL/FixJ family response regulator
MESRLRVLVVDDHPLFLESAVGLLMTQPGVEVVGMTRTGSEAIALASELVPDVVFLDVAMPELDGWTTARALRALALPPEVIFVTLYDEPEYAQKARELGAAALINKIEFAAVVGPLLESLITRRGTR